MSKAYRIIEEWSAPVYADSEANKHLYVSDETSLQGYWVVSWGEEEQGIY